MEVLQIKNLNKTYVNEKIETIALKDVSFQLEEGTFVAITGTSGCGKSTLLHIIAGIDQPTSGNVVVNNKDITALTKDELALYRRRKVGLIYQFYNLVSVLNVWDNIILPLKLDAKEIDHNHVNHILTVLQLSEKKNAFPSQLSGGQQQRVAIARAMVTNPLIMLADEPTGNLDKKNSQEVMNQLLKLHKENKQTILMVTHDYELARQCDRIITLEDGKIIKDEDHTHVVSL